MNRRIAAASVGVLALGALSLGVSHIALGGTGGGATALSNAYVRWEFPQVPSGGMSNVAFPMTVNAATARVSGVYFAQQFKFMKQEKVAYIGLQPRVDRNGRKRMRAVFSNFVEASKPKHVNCHKGADTWDGTSCGVDFDAAYGQEYALTVEQTGADIWTGTVRDSATKNIIVTIGTFEVPAGSGGVQASETGFVEYYLSAPSCDVAPQSNVTFGAPRTTSPGGQSVSGKITKSPFQHEDQTWQACRDRFSFAATGDAALRVTRGAAPEAGAPVGWITGLADKCLSVDDFSLKNGTPATLSTCGEGWDQQWTMRADHTVRAIGMCLEVSGGGTAEGTPVTLRTCDGSAAQQWTYTPGRDLVNPKADKCLDVKDNNSADGARMQLWTCSGTGNQKWTVPTMS